MRWVGDGQAQAKWDLETYLALGHVVCEWGGGRLTSSDERVAVQLGYARRREVSATNFSVVPQLLIGTSAWPARRPGLAHLLALNAPLQVLPCPMPMPVLQEVAQWHKYRDRDPALVWFSGIARSRSGSLETSKPLATR